MEELLDHNLWRRSKEKQYNKSSVIILENSFKPHFSQLEVNTYVDTCTKQAALTVSPSIVSLISYSGEEKIFWASGIVLESYIVNDIFVSIILTSASLLRLNGIENSRPKDFKVEVILPNGNICSGDIFAFDWHYNLCAIEIKSSALLPTVKLRCLDDAIDMIDASECKDKFFQLCPHSNLFKLFPGGNFIALGRYHCQPYDLMVAPGRYSIDRCGFACKELLRVNCKITKCGIGGPMINICGEVVGINFYDENFTPFLPMNVICKWWESIKGCRHGEFNRPWLGMQVSTLYGAEVQELEIIMRKFPDISKGIIVEEVTPGSPAASAGIRSDDVIVQFGGEDVQTCLQLFEVTWNKIGKEVCLAVRRASTGEHINLPMVIGCVDATQFNCWPLPGERWQRLTHRF